LGVVLDSFGRGAGGALGEKETGFGAAIGRRCYGAADAICRRLEGAVPDEGSVVVEDVVWFPKLKALVGNCTGVVSGKGFDVHEKAGRLF